MERFKHGVVAAFLFVGLLTCRLAASGQARHDDSVATVHAVRTSEKVDIDGKLSEPAWESAEPFANFHQRDPNEGEPATERNQIRVLYDDSFLYIAAALYDTSPTQIVSRLSRSDDNPDSDYFALYLDPYHDHLTGRIFQVSAAGVQLDSTISNDITVDNSWDGVWESAVFRTDTGWFVEMRIPFSQLRFSPADQYMWGINAARFIHRKNETAWLEMVPKREYGLASRMAQLVGLQGIEAHHNLEILPYARSNIDLSPPNARTPFNDGTSLFGASGVDAKYGINSNLILDATINPDFGQVEVDPAVVNISQFETFFQERRPFF